MKVMEFNVQRPTVNLLRESEVGPIPQDWKVIELAARATIQSGIAKNANATLRDALSVPYLRVANVQDGYLDLGEVSMIDIERADLNRYAVLPGDVLMNEGGDLDKLGRGALWCGQISPCVHQNHVFVVRCKDGLVPEYLNAWTSSAQARRYFMLAGRQTTNLASINKTSLGELTVAVPPTIEEQHHIAKALTDTDALVDSLEQLLTKKRQIRQGAMQGLLSGKVRLPGFKGKWLTLPAREVGVIRGGSCFPLNAQGESVGDYPFFKVSDMNSDGNESVMRTANHYISKSTRKRLGAVVFPAGSIVFAKVGAAIFLERKKILGQDSCIDNNLAAFVVDQSRVHVGYIHAQLLSKKLSSLVATTALPALSGKLLGAIPLVLPPHTEQVAIAQVLSDIDEEIASLELRLTKARGLKQAMTQALLTGRIRLVEPNA